MPDDLYQEGCPPLQHQTKCEADWIKRSIIIILWFWHVGTETNWIRKLSLTIEHNWVLTGVDITGKTNDQSIWGALISPQRTILELSGNMQWEALCENKSAHTCDSKLFIWLRWVLVTQWIRQSGFCWVEYLTHTHICGKSTGL